MIDATKYFTKTALKRQPSAIRRLMPLMKLPGMISLGGGLPNAQLFPVTGLSFNVQGRKDPITLSHSELAESLQYSGTPGLDGLVSTLRNLQIREHRPQYDKWGVCVTTGSQDALWKAFDLFLSPEDTLLVEDPTYAGALAFLRPLGCALQPVKCDEHGLIPSSLAEELSVGWKKRGVAKPKVLYTIPTGSNPAGSTLTTKRKEEILALAVEHDLIVFEDDPYFFLYYGKDKIPPPGSEACKKWNRPYCKSLLSMDTTGRVLRFDSFSKVLSSGLRLGWVTGMSDFVDKIALLQGATSLHTSGISQMIALKLLQMWGTDGWNDHVNEVCKFYGRKRDFMMGCADKHLKGLAQWGTPTAGMFMWIELLGLKDSRQLIETRARQGGVLMVPGADFSPDYSKGEPISPFVRASFSTASSEHIDEALQRLASLLKPAKL